MAHRTQFGGFAHLTVVCAALVQLGDPFVLPGRLDGRTHQRVRNHFEWNRNT